MAQSPKPKTQPKREGAFVAGKGAQKRAPTLMQTRAAKLISDNIRNPRPVSIGKLLLQAGYSKEVSLKPKLVTDSATFQDLLKQHIPDDNLATTHARLLNTRKIEHMVFPLGPIGEDDDNLSGSKPNASNEFDELEKPVERTTLTDTEIKEMLAEVNCQVKRIVHGQTARHVYFWAHDANAQTKALELAYKMKGVLGKGEGADAPPINFNFGNQNFIKGGGAQ